MRLAAACLLALLAATPAQATLGLLCRPVSGAGPTVSIVIPTGIGFGIAGVSLTERGVTLSTMGERAPIGIGQSWIDEQRLWIDLVDPNVTRSEGRLRLQYAGRGRGRHLAGTFVRNGRLYRMRCEES